MALLEQCIVIVLSLIISLNYVNSQNCIPPPKGMNIEEQAYRSSVVVKVKVTAPGKVNHTAVITEVYATKNGGLKKTDVITFGPVKKGKECPRIKKNSNLILFLEEPSTADPKFYRIKYNPHTKMNVAKKLKKKILCKGCYDCEECGPRGDGFCVNGRCCIVPVVNETACRCDPKYQGQRCDEKKVPLMPRSNINIIEARYHQQTIAIMGVCIALLLVIFICYVVYCKFKKSRSHLRKELIERNGHAGGRPADSIPERQISNSNTAGILGDEATSRDIQLTNYRSTNLSEPRGALSFAQRPQTYDDVILPGQESQPLVQEPPAHTGYHLRHEEALAASSRQQADARPNGRRRRRKGVAIGHSDDPQHSGSDLENIKGSRRINELKSSGQNSMSSSASSLASRDLKRPAIPLDERLSNLAMKGVHMPPAYNSSNNRDEVDSPDARRQSLDNTQMSHESPLQASAPASSTTSSSLPTSPTSRERVPSSVSSSSAHRVTTFDNEGRIEEEMLERQDSALQNVMPHSPNLSPQSTNQRLPPHDIFSDQNLRTPPFASPGSDISTGSHKMSPHMKSPYQNKNMHGNVYPYYEHSPHYPHSPSASRHDNRDENSGQFFGHDEQRLNPPSSPRQYQANPEMGMGVPYRPVTVASARHHHLPLLTKEKPELQQMHSEMIPMVGSTVSLSSSNSSNTTERNRNSHKIEV
uniref:uncharacterized protein LOC120347088 isoform X6 n=1 Tax=Styela clava TaxID=7725 RepID=UPI001939BB95|nr:uncharacterized protein LOC120347088 isoform X6 [Styela clava]